MKRNMGRECSAADWLQISQSLSDETVLLMLKTICSAHRFSDILKNTEKCPEISATTKTKSRLMMLKQTSCRDLPIGPTGHGVVGEFHQLEARLIFF